MLDYFTFCINEAIANIQWMKSHGMTESYWHKNNTEDIYFYLSMLEEEVDFPVYNY